MISDASTVNVVTNAPLGYKLYISSSNANLTSTDTSITQSFAPVSSTSLTPDTWGFSLDTGSSKSWQAVPQVTNPDSMEEDAIISAGATKISELATPNYPTGTDIPVYYGINATTNMPSGTYFTTVTYTAFGEGIPPEDITGATYLQDVTLEMCNNTDTGVTAELKDKRGYGNGGSDTTTTYTIVKAADGNCWMADNLRLYNKTISAEDSDFTSGTFSIPASSTWNTNNYTSALMHVADGTGTYADKNNTYGTYGEAYYNWCAATAQTSCGGTSVATTSICPKNWKLPLNGDKNTNYSYAKLLDSYSLTTGAAIIAKTELGFAKYYGHWVWDYASESDQGSSSRFWSATPSSADNAYNMYYNSGAVDPQRNNYKGYGFSVRCVVR